MPDMQGVEFQDRNHAVQQTTQYPLPLDRRIAQGDAYRQSKKRLETHLQSIEQFYSTPNAGKHSGSGQPDCNRCASKQRQIRQAYHQYYLATDPERWDSNMYQYREEMTQMFNEPERYPLEQIHRFQGNTLRDHLRADLCTPQPRDGASTALIDEISNMFDEGYPTAEILSHYLTNLLRNMHNPEAAEFVSRLQDTITPEERAQIYISFYCTNTWNDEPSVRNLKAKYARMFSELVSHDTVLAAMSKEAAESQDDKVRKLKGKLADLQMAKSAHLKDKKKKAEKADQKMMLDRHNNIEDGNKTTGCGLPRCHLEIDLTEETVECVICDWLVRKGSERRRVYYCSVEHAEEDFDEHDRNDHQCCTSHRCYYHPLAGPPGETGAGGVCQDCADADFTSYFCSKECYEYNLDFHRDGFHYERGIRNMNDSLEHFRPAEDLEVVPAEK